MRAGPWPVLKARFENSRAGGHDPVGAVHKGSSRMCGIIGIVGKQPVAERLIESLKRLEYRGYDLSLIHI